MIEPVEFNREASVSGQSAAGEQSADKKMSKATWSVTFSIRLAATPESDPDPDGLGTW
jgi:hypothetical protein